MDEVLQQVASPSEAADDQVMGSFGENLRREREMRGISLEEISAATKVSVRFLTALENDDFTGIPGGIFTRGFIRSYAEYMGMDPDQVIAEYEEAAHPQDYELHRLTSANRPAARGARPIRVFPLIVAAALLIGGYALFHYSHRSADMPLAPGQLTAALQPAGSRDQGKQATVATGTSAGSSASATEVPGGQATAGARPAADAAKTAAVPAATAPAGSPDGLVLQVAATEPVWVSVDADGRTSLQRVLGPKDVTTLKARDFFDLTTANSQALVLTLNGETLKPLGRQGEVKKIHLTREDLKSPSP